MGLPAFVTANCGEGYLLPLAKVLKTLHHDRAVVDEKIASHIVTGDEAEGFFGVEEFDRAGHFVTTHIEYLCYYVEVSRYTAMMLPSSGEIYGECERLFQEVPPYQ